MPPLVAAAAPLAAAPAPACAAAPPDENILSELPKS
jgi:hypothetical protein